MNCLDGLGSGRSCGTLCVGNVMASLALNALSLLLPCAPGDIAVALLSPSHLFLLVALFSLVALSASGTYHRYLKT
jgi:thiol:disulfide interchange protein